MRCGCQETPSAERPAAPARVFSAEDDVHQNDDYPYQHRKRNNKEYFGDASVIEGHRARAPVDEVISWSKSETRLMKWKCPRNGAIKFESSGGRTRHPVRICAGLTARRGPIQLRWSSQYAGLAAAQWHLWCGETPHRALVIGGQALSDLDKHPLRRDGYSTLTLSES